MKEQFPGRILSDLYASVGQVPSSYKHWYGIHVHAAIPQSHLLNTNVDMTGHRFERDVLKERIKSQLFFCQCARCRAALFLDVFSNSMFFCTLWGWQLARSQNIQNLLGQMQYKLLLDVHEPQLADCDTAVIG